MPSDANALGAVQARPGNTLGQPPLIAHIIYRLDVGGLENGLVNLINNIPNHIARHAVICLTDFTEFRQRIRRPDVEVHALHKPPGNSLTLHLKCWSLLRKLKPDVVHSRNLAALECQFAAMIAGVPVRIHSEHGRDMTDVDGTNPKHIAVRRFFRPFVHHTIALSKDLERYLLDTIGVKRERLSQIYNGVDTDKFTPAGFERPRLQRVGFDQPNHFIIGTVGRMDAVKDPVNLARAFVALNRILPERRGDLRLIMVGDGAMRAQVESVLREANLLDHAWLTGTSDGVAELMRCMDVFVLPSMNEGVSNTILEAMASGLPVVATNVGGNPELVRNGETGKLVPRADAEALAAALVAYVRQPDYRLAHGRAARRVALEQFSFSGMIDRYCDLYTRMLREKHAAFRNTVQQ